MSNLALFLSESPVFLISPWKPIVIWLIVAWWAWLLATRIQRDVRFYRFDVEKWNIAFLLSGIVGLGLMLFGWNFYVGWPVGVLVMFAPIFVYWKKRNALVPESERFVLTLARSPEAKQRRALKKALRDVTLKYTDSHKETVTIPGEEEPGRGPFMALESVLAPALERRASRLDLGLGAGGCVAICTVDSVRSKLDTFEPEQGAQIFHLLRTMAGLDLAETRRKQTGEFQVMGPLGHHRLTVMSTGSGKGQLLRIDVDRAQQVRIPYDALGLLDQQRAILDPLIQADNRNGIVLLSSPTGQGLTTTCYAIMATHDSYTSNVRSLEREVEAELEGVVQQVWDPSDPAVDYARMLQSMLRRDPDVIVVTGVEDAETAQVAAASGADGPLLYLAMSANNTIATLTKWIQLVGDPARAGAPLRGIVHQRLLRRLCDNCKVGFVPADTGRFRLPDGTQLYKAGGQVQDRNKIIECPVCRGGGYLGVVGVFEVTPISDECRKSIMNGDLKGALTAARREKMILMQEAAMREVIAGVTSIEEIGRVLSPRKKAPATSTQTSEAAKT